MDSKIISLIDAKRKGAKPVLTFTEEQEEFLVYCRDSQFPVSYSNMRAIWIDGTDWGNVSEDTLRRGFVKFSDVERKIIWTRINAKKQVESEKEKS